MHGGDGRIRGEGESDAVPNRSSINTIDVIAHSVVTKLILIAMFGFGATLGKDSCTGFSPFFPIFERYVNKQQQLRNLWFSTVDLEFLSIFKCFETSVAS